MVFVNVLKCTYESRPKYTIMRAGKIDYSLVRMGIHNTGDMATMCTVQSFHLNFNVLDPTVLISELFRIKCKISKVIQSFRSFKNWISNFNPATVHSTITTTRLIRQLEIFFFCKQWKYTKSLVYKLLPSLISQL